MIFNNITTCFSAGWAMILIMAFISILVFGQELRNFSLELLKDKNSRRWIALTALLVGILHLIGYQYILGGKDIVLICMGYLSIVKGLIFLFAPGFIDIFEDLIVSRGIVLWLLIVVALVIYFINNVFHFIS